MEDVEIWREIIGYEGLYQVSNIGRVRNTGLHVKAASVSNAGYAFVGLSKNGAQKTTYIHKLVAATFIGDLPAGKHQVNHIDGVKTNNRAENLEYVTRSENARHAIDVLGRMSIGERTRARLYEIKRGPESWSANNPERLARGERQGSSKLTADKVRLIRQLYAEGRVTQTELAEQFSISQANVYYVVHNLSWKHVS